MTAKNIQEKISKVETKIIEPFVYVFMVLTPITIIVIKALIVLQLI